MARRHGGHRGPPQSPRGPAQPAPSHWPSVETEASIATWYGTDWLEAAGNAMLWAFILLEIPKQLLEIETKERRSLEEREDFLTEHFRGPDPESRKLRETLSAPLAPHCEMRPAAGADGCIVAALLPRGMDPREIHFALCQRGVLMIRCVKFPDGAEKLPALLARRPRDCAAAQETARVLVKRAIELLRKP